MRILCIGPRSAGVLGSGSRVRTGNLLRGLALHHQHRVIAFVEGWPARPWAVGLSVRTVGPRYREIGYSHPVAWLLRWVAESGWVSAPVLAGVSLRLVRPAALGRLIAWSDLILVDFPWQFAYVESLADGRPLVYGSHNVESGKFRSYAAIGRPRLTRGLWLRIIDRMERRAVRHAARVVAVSGSDQETFLGLSGLPPERFVVVPNGAAVERYLPTAPADRAAARARLGLPERPTVLFLGSGAPPNREGLRWVRLLAEAEPGFNHLVVGGVAPAGRQGSCWCTGPVESIDPYLAAADLAIVPIAFGGGTKIKLFESLAAGLPVVAFAEAIAGTDLVDGEHLLLAEASLDALRHALGRLTAEPDRAAAIGAAGRAFVERHHSWCGSAAILNRALEALAAGTRRRESPLPLRASGPGRRLHPRLNS